MRYLFLTPFLAFCVLLFNLGSSGGAASNGQAATGAPQTTGGNESTCSGCHGGGSYSPTIQVQVFEAGTTTEASALRNTRTYDVRVRVLGNGIPTSGGYGFQLVALKNVDKSDAGTFSSAGAGVQFSTIGSRVYAEHSAKSSTGVFTFKWKPNSTSAVTFYYIGNAVDGSGTSSGDSPTTAQSKSINMATANDTELPENTWTVDVYPNPTASHLFLKTTATNPLKLVFYDVLGREIHTQTLHEAQASVDIHSFEAGRYFVRISDGKTSIVRSFEVLK